MRTIIGVAAVAVVALIAVQWLHARSQRPSQDAYQAPAPTDIQRALTDLGFDPGPVDGQLGPRTRRALQAFQQSKGLPVSGEADRETWDALRAPTQSQGARSSSDMLPRMERLFVDVAEASPRQEAQVEVMEHRLRAPQRVKKLQLALKRAGFHPGPIDGELGPKTEEALAAFQRAFNLEPEGIDGLKTWAVLNHYIDPNEP